MHDSDQTPARRERPSLRVLLVPRLLAHGLAPGRVARIAGVPAALVWLIAETTPTGPAASTNPLGGRGRDRRETPAPARSERLRRLVTLAVYALGCTATIAWHQPFMPLAVAAAAMISARRY